MPGTLDDELKSEIIVWRPVMAKVITVQEVKSGAVTLSDLLKINAMLDMRSDCDYYYAHRKEQ